MEAYLIDKQTNKIKEIYSNVIYWGNNFVEYKDGGGRCKIYCTENEYISADKPKELNNEEE